jgi:predicted TIM-barrel fold metal-dependent hydrolase
MHRREFLAGSAALVASIAGADELALSQTPLSNRVIDAHCHLFNARDLPIEGFAKKVLIRENPRLNDLFARYPDALVVMIHTLAQVMQEDAPTPAQEISLLTDIERGLKAPPNEAARRKRELAIVKTILTRIWSKQILRGLRFRDAEAANVGLERLQRLILEEAYSPHMFDGVVQEEQIEEVIQSQNLDDLAMRLYDEPDDQTIARNIHWALLFTRYRFELSDQLQQLHQDKTILLTPAIVDLAKWVEDDTPSAIREQVDVMARVSLREKGPRVHGFVGFDPLRQALHQKSGGAASEDPLAIVQDAIENKGFIGVKLYPPMGFRPTDNAAEADRFPNHVKAILGPAPGGILDTILDGLYAWCASKDVPVMAHAINSQAAGPDYGKRADPKYWALVLKAHPRLRLNMAHFGGFIEKGNPARLDNTWEWTMGEIFKGGPNGYAYADLSYFSEILGARGDARRSLLNDFSSFRNTFPNSATRLLYGTDWTMVGREEGFHLKQTYPQIVSAFLRDCGYTDAEIEGMMVKNAVRYLGLGADNRQNGTRGRLERFYADNHHSADWLKQFD